MAGSGLTARQAAFCEAFVLGGSAAAAARAAGYSPNSARTQAWRLLRRPAVQRRLRELRNSAQAGEGAFAARLMARAERLWDAAQADENHGLALRVMQMQFRIAGRYGVPPDALVMGDEATLNDLTLTALVAETRRIELPAGVNIGPDLREAAVTRPDGRVPHPDLPPKGKGRREDGGEQPHAPEHVPRQSPDDSFPRLQQARDEARSDCEAGAAACNPQTLPSPLEHGQPPQAVPSPREEGQPPYMVPSPREEGQPPNMVPSPLGEGQPPNMVPSPLGEGQDGGRAEGASGATRPHPRASVNIPLSDSLPARQGRPSRPTNLGTLLNC